MIVDKLVGIAMHVLTAVLETIGLYVLICILPILGSYMLFWGIVFGGILVWNYRDKGGI